MLRFAICDDDPVFVGQVGTIVQQYSSVKFPLKTTLFSTSQSLLDEITDGAYYDVFLLDIEMPDINGLDVAEKIREQFPDAVILFLTSHLQFSRLGYKSGALRYVSKLHLKEELPEALEASMAAAGKVLDKYLTIRRYNDAVRIAHQEIVFIRRISRALEISTLQRGIMRDNRGLKDMHKCLNDARFIYIDRSTIVNMDYICQITESEVHLTTGERLPISRKMLPGVKKIILHRWGLAK